MELLWICWKIYCWLVRSWCKLCVCFSLLIYDFAFAVTWTGQCLSQTYWSPVLWTHTSTSGTSSKNQYVSAFWGNHWTLFHNYQLAGQSMPWWVLLFSCACRDFSYFPLSPRWLLLLYFQASSESVMGARAAQLSYNCLASLSAHFRYFLRGFSWSPRVFFSLLGVLAELMSTISWSYGHFLLNSTIVACSPSVLGSPTMLFKKIFLFVPFLVSWCCFLPLIFSG